MDKSDGMCLQPASYDVFHTRTEQPSRTEPENGSYSHMEIRNTFDLFEEHCASELQFVHSNKLPLTAERDSYPGLHTKLGGATLNETDIDWLRVDGPVLTDSSNIYCYNVHASDTVDVIYVDDISYPESNSEDENLTVHFGEQTKLMNVFECKVCHISLKNLNLLKRHEVKHSVERPYKCSLCSYAGKNKRGLKSHMVSHTTDKPFQCSWCDYTSKRSPELKQHLRCHTKDLPNKCQLCSFSSFRPRDLHTHYMCDHQAMAKCASLSSDRQEHTRRQCHTCKYCDYKCDTLKMLESHMKKHPQIAEHYICVLCQDEFHQKSLLDLHIWKHLGRQRYSCNICHRAFSKPVLLTQHKKCHGEEKQNDETSSSGSKIANRDKSVLRKTSVRCSRSQYRANNLSKKVSYHCPDKGRSCSTLLKLHRRRPIQKRSQSKESPVRKARSRGNQRSQSVNYRWTHPSTTETTRPQRQHKRLSRTNYSLEIQTQKLQTLVNNQTHTGYSYEYFDTSVTSFRLHIVSEKADIAYTCDLCNYASRSYNNLETHLSKHSTLSLGHDGTQFHDKQKQMSKYGHGNKSGDQTEIHFICNTCGFVSDRLATLQSHLPVHGEEEACKAKTSEHVRKSNNTQKQCDQERENRSKTELVYACDICGFTCDRIATLESHLPGHREEDTYCLTRARLYKCAICPFTSDDVELLKKHLSICNIIIGLW